ncbi:MAG TPA: glycosyltransferase [Thermoanaerobaculia bacterium]|nr:glycosyltransferase [Thermoanaerobaculia bacterium]
MAEAPPAGVPRDFEPVHFFLPGEADLERLRGLDPDRDWQDFVRGEHAWILQTYLRLRSFGYPVELVGEPPPSGLVVFHAKHEGVLLRHARQLREAVLVGVRGDLREPLAADFQVLQNHVWADGRSRFFVPHWLQPGLLPRDPARGTRIEKVVFKGFSRNLHADFHQPRWRDQLRERGIEWVFDATDFEGTGTAVGRLSWHDFREADLILAVRPPSSRGHTAKPATKLCNAWAAGVPALLGPEPAYRELRESELDYLEVSSSAEALAAIDRLRASPELYLAMVEQARRRVAAFTPAAIASCWVDLLWQRIPDLAGQRPLRGLPLRLRPLLRRLARLGEGRPAR